MPLYVMSEAVSTKTRQVTGGNAPPKTDTASERKTPPEHKDENAPTVQQLMPQQLEEMRAMHRGQMESLDRVLQEQRQHGQRLTRLEEAVFQSQPIHQYQPNKQQYTGCFNCGDHRHLARSCPHPNFSGRPQAPAESHQMSAPPANSASLNGQNLPL